MKNRRSKYSTTGLKSHGVIKLPWIPVLCMILAVSCVKEPGQVEIKSYPEIYPEYIDLTIPDNIAPLNFVIKEPGTRYRIKIHAAKGRGIDMRQRSPKIKIPVKKWQELLSANSGDSLSIEVYILNDKKWQEFKTIRHYISPDPIDPWLVYRLVHAVYLKWMEMGIYQRNLTDFKEIPVIENSSTDHACMNCHSFAGKDPSKMMIHFRINHSGTLVWDEGKLSKLDTKTMNTLSAGIYPSWHPEGRYIAFSTGKLNPHMTTRLNKVVDVADRVSDLVILDVENNTVSTPPALSTSRRENLPVWSPDGKYLYFLSAPEAPEGDLDSLLHSKYDLMRISFNSTTGKWGETELIMAADSTGMSMSIPSISPDGRFLVCSMSDYGYFTIFHKSSDLYCIDLETREYHKLGLNSNSAESYSSWSSNSRWLVFSSKRMDDVFTRPFIAYIDKEGKSRKAFALPQEDPEMYYTLLANYNRPELITGKIELDPSDIREVVMQEAGKAGIGK